MNEIPLKILIVDSSIESGNLLRSELHEHSFVISISQAKTLSDARKQASKGFNAIYIDPLALGVEKSVEFIVTIRDRYPVIVFVLYTDLKDAKATELFRVQNRRFRDYFKLDKATPAQAFRDEVLRTVELCQNDLSFTLTQDRIEELQGDLAEIQEGAKSDEAVPVPLDILRELQEQLEARGNELAQVGKLGSPATFLGPSSSVRAGRCFVIMPYSQVWSESVQNIIEKVCQSVGIEPTIAKTMDGRFVAHDIWDGITGSEIIIADLTGANPNVTYEVGLADAIGRRVILIAQHQEVPFDFHGHRLILYENTIEGGLSLQQDLHHALSSINKPGE